MDDRAQPPVRVPAQFESYYRQDYAAVVALTAVLTRNPWVAEDLAQEAFLRAHRDWDQVGRMESPHAWVRRVAINLANSRFRRLRSEATTRLRLGAVTSAMESLEPDDDAFWEEVRRLPRRQAQVLALKYLEDLAVADIASIVGIAEGTVRALLHQGRERLQRQLIAKGLVS